MRELETKNENSGLPVGTKSTPTTELGTRETELLKRENKMLAASRGLPILVSEQQFSTVREEHLKSLDLLNSSGNVLLGAMESMVPPKDSGRMLGEYTSQGMRQIAKSICDIIQTKTSVIRSMYAISRDEM